eukprot:4628920-Pyramimonas_sp.AAC.1
MMTAMAMHAMRKAMAVTMAVRTIGVGAFMARSSCVEFDSFVRCVSYFRLSFVASRVRVSSHVVALR